MNARHLLAFALAALALAAAPAKRSVRLLPANRPGAVVTFDRAQSAALFVGVRKFTNDGVLAVPYAVDDAVDLAYAFAFDPRVSLVPPNRIVLALSGAPHKPQSRRRLQRLKDAGATESPARRSDIVRLLQRQAMAAGKNGILILSFASHGVMHGDTAYVLGSESLIRDPKTAVSTAIILDVAAKSHAGRSLIFIDACRERITAGARGTSPDPRTAAPLIRRMKRIHGQVVFYGAAAGRYTYDDPSGNGVFTKAVLEGLDCKAGKTRGFVTVDTLRKYVARRVHRNRTIGMAIQVNLDDDTHNMPLSQCTVSPPPPAPDPVRVTKSGTRVAAFGADGKQLWTRDLHESIAQADVLRRYTGQIVALSSKYLWILDSDGRVAARIDDAAPLQWFTIDHATDKHVLKIVVSSRRSVFVIEKNRKLWRGRLQPPSETVARVEIVDHDRDSWREIAVSTTSGNVFYLDFEGRLIDQQRPPNAPNARLIVTPNARNRRRSR